MSAPTTVDLELLRESSFRLHVLLANPDISRRTWWSQLHQACRVIGRQAPREDRTDDEVLAMQVLLGIVSTE